MPHAPATRPPITMMGTWLAAPMISRMIPKLRAMAPITGPAFDLAVRAGGADTDGAGWEGPRAGGTGPRGAYPRGSGGAWAGPIPGTVHQMVSPGGAILRLSCGIGPVPARPRGADSGGGAGSGPAAIRAVSA